jgi:hypothetical protein
VTQLSPKASAVEEIAYRTGHSRDAVTSTLSSIVAGRGAMAQFGHPEFGGSGSRSKHARGILTEAEFSANRAELLDRL